jgi:hypothetical protein
MSSVAAAITIPVTNAVKQENSSRSLRTTLMAAPPCGPWFIPRAQRSAHLYRGRKVIKWNFGPRVRLAFADPSNRVSHSRAGPSSCESDAAHLRLAAIGGLTPTMYLQRPHWLDYDPVALAVLVIGIGIKVRDPAIVAGDGLLAIDHARLGSKVRPWPRRSAGSGWLRYSAARENIATRSSSLAMIRGVESAWKLSTRSATYPASQGSGSLD